MKINPVDLTSESRDVSCERTEGRTIRQTDRWHEKANSRSSQLR